MTVIVGYIDRDNDIVYIGGDSRSNQDGNYDTLKDKKVFLNGDFLIGACGTLRLCNMLHYQFVPPEHPKGMSVEEYMNKLFVNEVQSCFDTVGLSRKVRTSEEEGDYIGTFLVGYKGRLFTIGCDYAVSEVIRDYDAIGSGGMYALGALDIMDILDYKIGLSIDKRIEQALITAGNFDSNCGEPYYVLKL